MITTALNSSSSNLIEKYIPIMGYGLRRDRFMYPDAVNKSWPQFWDFMKHMQASNN